MLRQSVNLHPVGNASDNQKNESPKQDDEYDGCGRKMNDDTIDCIIVGGGRLEDAGRGAPAQAGDRPGAKDAFHP